MHIYIYIQESDFAPSGSESAEEDSDEDSEGSDFVDSDEGERLYTSMLGRISHLSPLTSQLSPLTSHLSPLARLASRARNHAQHTRPTLPNRSHARATTRHHARMLQRGAVR